MAATFFERCIRVGDWENDGGVINLSYLGKALILFEAGLVDDDYVAGECLHDGGGALTTPQRADLDDLLATMPTALISAINAVSRARWPHKVAEVLWAGLNQTAFTSDATVKTALGI